MGDKSSSLTERPGTGENRRPTALESILSGGGGGGGSGGSGGGMDPVCYFSELASSVSFRHFPTILPGSFSILP